MFTSRQKAHSYGRTSKPGTSYGTDDWPSSDKPKEMADDDDALGAYACACRAPLMRPVALPNIEEFSDTASPELLYSGLDLRRFSGTFDGVPEMVALEHLSFTLPVRFPVDDGLLAFSKV